MKKNIAILYCLISFILGLHAVAEWGFGQTYRTFASELDDINTRARWKWGPFRIFPSLQFTHIGYDSNVYYAPDREKPVSDYSATVSFRVDLSFVFRDWLIFTFSENPAYVYYAKQESQRYLNNTYSFNLKLLAFSRMALSGTTQMSSAKIRWTGEIGTLTVLKNKETSGRIFYETPRNTSFGFTGLIRELKYENATGTPGLDPISVSLNREERSAKGEFNYRVFSDSFFFLNGGYSEYSFDYPQSRFRNSYSYEGYSGIRFPLLGRARGVLSLGYKKLVPRIKGINGFSGLVGNTGIDFRFGRFAYRLEYVRELPFSAHSNSLFYVGNRYGLGISFYLNKFIRLDYNFRSGQNNYPEPTLIRLPTGDYVEIKRRDNYLVHSGAIVIRIIKNTGIGIEGNYLNRESNYPGINLKRFFVGGYITYDF